MEYSGYAEDWDQVVIRGEPSSGRFIAFWLREGVILAGMNVNIWEVRDTIAALVTARLPIDPATLADPDVDLAGSGR